jgi:hypothetical protein
MTPSSNNLSANKICRGDPKSKTKTAKKKRKEKNLVIMRRRKWGELLLKL